MQPARPKFTETPLLHALGRQAGRHTGGQAGRQAPYSRQRADRGPMASARARSNKPRTSQTTRTASPSPAPQLKSKPPPPPPPPPHIFGPLGTVLDLLSLGICAYIGGWWIYRHTAVQTPLPADNLAAALGSGLHPAAVFSAVSAPTPKLRSPPHHPKTLDFFHNSSCNYLSGAIPR